MSSLNSRSVPKAAGVLNIADIEAARSLNGGFHRQQKTVSRPKGSSKNKGSGR
jgi:hypothetical protein